VHHPPATEVQADVAEALEEEDVAGLYSRLAYTASLAVERVRVMREVDGDSPPHRYGVPTASRASFTARSARGGGAVAVTALGPRLDSSTIAVAGPATIR